MAKNRKIPTAVRHQVLVARADEAQETGQASPSSRKALAQARLAARKARSEALAARDREPRAPMDKPRLQPRMKPAVEHRLTQDGLVILARAIIGFRLGATTNPYVPLQKGAVGVLVARAVATAQGRRAVGPRCEMCHVMLPEGTVELPAAALRSCDEDS